MKNIVKIVTLAAFVKLASLLLRSTESRYSWDRLEPLEGTIAYLASKKVKLLKKHTSTLFQAVLTLEARNHFSIYIKQQLCSKK